ncbi:aluminum-activated malate transporter 10 [Olea europaea subsp. europaea]|uniref:Aluminum-activated malate transporter 10 n=1 Tax=Olea europaea subsp. europaea TaxID=158383 RepID=A0A8S0Q2F6_OLEEU|nr:aluminum-activated malate transporter 10 [Olea europaea subsp. europaea]
MVKESKQSGGLEWRVNVPNENTSKVLVPESKPQIRVFNGLRGLIVAFVSRICKFLEKAWSLAVREPKKAIHGLKVGMALSIVSLFYYMRPLYNGVGGNAMWAVMTVVVVFEYTVGATLCKCVNRATGTLLAGALGLGIHWIANQSGEKFEPIILQVSVFLLAAAATFSRFIPTIKARFDYGALIFILTFSLVSVSGYRVDKLFELAHHRLSTIAIGTSLCIIITMLFCPVWAGNELHCLITNNMEKIAASLNGCVVEYFGISENVNANGEDSDKVLQGYKCVLNSKTAEEAMANFARWEPAYGNFNFRHPWNEYLKVGALLRKCAYCIETLNVSTNSDTEAPNTLKKLFSKYCIRLSSCSSDVLKELAVIMNTMTKSIKIDLMVHEMNNAVQELQGALESLSEQPIIGDSKHSTEEGDESSTIVPLMEIVPIVSMSTLLIEVAARIEKSVEAVNELANKAEFEEESTKKSKQSQNQQNPKQPSQGNQEDTTMKTLQNV